MYGVPEDELGEFYAQRTLLKREVLPEHVAAAVFALTGGDLSQTTGSAHPGRRRVSPPRSCADRAGRRRRRRPRRLERPGHGRPGRRRTRSSSTEVHRFPNEPVPLPDGLHWDVLRPVPRGPRRAARRGAGRPSWPASASTRGRSTTACSTPTARCSASPFHYRDARTDGGRRARCTRSSRRPSCTRGPACSSCRSTRSTSWPPAADGRRSDGAATMLLMPDLLGYWLTGELGAELTNASTTGLLDVRAPATGRPELIDRLDMPPRLLAAAREPGRRRRHRCAERRGRTGLRRRTP